MTALDRIEIIWAGAMTAWVSIISLYLWWNRHRWY